MSVYDLSCEVSRSIDNYENAKEDLKEEIIELQTQDTMDDTEFTNQNPSRINQTNPITF